MSATILQGDVFAMLPTIKRGSVDCCVSSPPYWALRSYLPKDHPLKHLEIGQEKSPAEYVAKIVRVFDLVWECLAEHGTCWLNVGDTYSGSGAGGGGNRKGNEHGQHDAMAELGRATTAINLDAGSLCLIPQRLAVALQDAGWIVRSIICWWKPAPMPISVSGWAWRRCRVKVKGIDRAVNAGRNGDLSRQGAGVGPRSQRDDYFDNRADHWRDCPGCKKCEPANGYVLRRGSWRPTSSYEPILMLAKSKDYFADGEPVKTPAAESTISRDQYTRVLEDADEQFAVRHDHETTCDSGANLRDVWRIGAEPLREGHYAAYPTELVRKCLQAGTSERGYCGACGKPWARVIESPFRGEGNPIAYKDRGEQGNRMALAGDEWRARQIEEPNKTIGWRPSCLCPKSEPRPALVLDPFSGSGRTAQAAQWLGLDFIGTELNPAYVEMSERILRADSPLFT